MHYWLRLNTCISFCLHCYGGYFALIYVMFAPYLFFLTFVWYRCGVMSNIGIKPHHRSLWCVVFNSSIGKSQWSSSLRQSQSLKLIVWWLNHRMMRPTSNSMDIFRLSFKHYFFNHYSICLSLNSFWSRYLCTLFWESLRALMLFFGMVVPSCRQEKNYAPKHLSQTYFRNQGMCLHKRRIFIKFYFVTCHIKKVDCASEDTVATNNRFITAIFYVYSCLNVPFHNCPFPESFGVSRCLF